MSVSERFCPVCGARRHGEDRFCHRCGATLPATLPAGESAPAVSPAAGVAVAGPAPAEDEKTAGWSDFFLHPKRLFAHGSPPTWGIALALVALIGLGSGAVDAVLQTGLEELLPGFISSADLPAGISDQFNQALAANRQNAPSRVAGEVIGLAYSIPMAIAGYLIVSAIFFGLGKWAGGSGGWESFTRNYALLVIPEIPALVVDFIAVSLLLAPVPRALLLLAGLVALLVRTLMWAWRIWLRYALLTGNLRVSSNRAAAIVAGWEALKIALLALVVGAVFLLAMLVMLVAGSGS